MSLACCCRCALQQNDERATGLGSLLSCCLSAFRCSGCLWLQWLQHTFGSHTVSKYHEVSVAVTLQARLRLQPKASRRQLPRCTRRWLTPMRSWPLLQPRPWATLLCGVLLFLSQSPY